ncbi:MAG: XdhC family protein [Pseudomonadota bacterium]
MTPAILEQLNAARAGAKPALVVRRLRDNAQSLWIDGLLVDGDALPAEVETTLLDALRSDRSTKLEAAGESWFVQVFNPPLRLVVVGAVHIAQALVPMAQVAGYAVTVVDPRRAFGSDVRFPGVSMSNDWPDEALAQLQPDARTAVVTLTHDPKIDDPALVAALRSEAFYVAALGSKRTHGQRVERLRAAGFVDVEIGRVHGPAGLPLGAVSPAEIAISVLAEMTSVLRRAA